jgi:anti-sigma regulatory factor (Ser/Thr protein kinase)
MPVNVAPIQQQDAIMSYNQLLTTLQARDFIIKKTTKNDVSLLSITAKAKSFYENDIWEDTLINTILIHYQNDNIQPSDLAFKLRTCITEAITNAIIHGNCDMPEKIYKMRLSAFAAHNNKFDHALNQKDKGAKPITIRITLSHKKIKIAVKDSGAGFDVKKVMQKLELEYGRPLYNNNKYAELKFPSIAQANRRGLFLISNTCHKVKHSHKGRCINMYWDLNKMKSY